MSEEGKAPKAVSLNTGEWKAVVLNNIATMHTALSNVGAPDDAGLAQIDQFFAKTRLLMHAWKVAGAQEAAQAAKAAADAQAQTVEVVESSGNGAVPVKKKGGWPRGKKRGAPAQAVAQ